MVSRLENFKFSNYNNGLRSGGGGWGRRWGGQVKLYTHLLRFVKNLPFDSLDEWGGGSGFAGQGGFCHFFR